MICTRLICVCCVPVHCCPEMPEPATRYAVEYPQTLEYGLNVSRLEACELPAMGALRRQSVLTRLYGSATPPVCLAAKRQVFV